MKKVFLCCVVVVCVCIADVRKRLLIVRSVLSINQVGKKYVRQKDNTHTHTTTK